MITGHRGRNHTQNQQRHPESKPMMVRVDGRQATKSGGLVFAIAGFFLAQQYVCI
ncbi:MAG: hypothetical protein F6K65_25340 [Moorea sp. SIO3C2]|nr:hypothetical protein [Moorena sp. SIO3C2]